MLFALKLKMLFSIKNTGIEFSMLRQRFDLFTSSLVLVLSIENPTQRSKHVLLYVETEKMMHVKKSLCPCHDYEHFILLYISEVTRVHP
jgi:hypothetical protein